MKSARPTMKDGDSIGKTLAKSSELEKVKARLKIYLSKEVKAVGSDVQVCSELLSLGSEALARARQAKKEKKKSGKDLEGMKIGKSAASPDTTVSATTASSDGARPSVLPERDNNTWQMPNGAK